MAGSIVEQDDLVLALMSGVTETPPLATFVQRLLARTQASHAVLLFSPGRDTAGKEREVVQFSTARPRAAAVLDIGRLMALDLRSPGSLRPDRIYAIDEMLDYDRPPVLERQRETLAAMGVRYGRWLRVVAGGESEARLLLTRDSEDFSSAAVAALASIVPYLKAALRLLAQIGAERMHREAAQTALGRLGIGQIVLDENAVVLGADAVAEAALPFVTSRGGRRLQLATAADDALVRACRKVAAPNDAAAQPVCLTLGDDFAVLIEPAPRPKAGGSRRAAAIATVRLARREGEAEGTRCLRTLYRLSRSEAALVEKLSRGLTIAEAGRALNLTEETARNYSKRIYARTGARGQADLVRIVLSGLSPLT